MRLIPVQPCRIRASMPGVESGGDRFVIRLAVSFPPQVKDRFIASSPSSPRAFGSRLIPSTRTIFVYVSDEYLFIYNCCAIWSRLLTVK
jgi:hypothetical protein